MRLKFFSNHQAYSVGACRLGHHFKKLANVAIAFGWCGDAADYEGWEEDTLPDVSLISAITRADILHFAAKAKSEMVRLGYEWTLRTADRSLCCSSPVHEKERLSVEYDPTDSVSEAIAIIDCCAFVLSQRKERMSLTSCQAC